MCSAVPKPAPLAVARSWRAMCASISASSSSESLRPSWLKNLMPLSANGLCEAETTTPASAPRFSTSAASPGVGITPAICTRPPPLVMPATSAASSMGPLRRVSRPITNRGCSPRCWASTAAAARPTCTANSAVSRSPATPRMPSVPKSLPMVTPPGSAAGLCYAPVRARGNERGMRGGPAENVERASAWRTAGACGHP